MASHEFNYKAAPMNVSVDKFNENWDSIFGQKEPTQSGKKTFVRKNGELVEIPNGNQKKKFPNLYKTELERYRSCPGMV